MPLHIVLVHPEIPPNTGNIIRLTANTGAHLHLVEPLGFPIDHSKMRRAGLDYHEHANMQVHPTIDAAYTAIAATDTAGNNTPNHYAITADGKRRYDQVTYQPNDVLLFGSESSGLPPEVRRQFPANNQLYIPMRPNSRSINLSNAVAIIIMEAWRQQNYSGAAR